MALATELLAAGSDPYYQGGRIVGFLLLLLIVGLVIRSKITKR
jgi:hypothetical protein